MILLFVYLLIGLLIIVSFDVYQFIKLNKVEEISVNDYIEDYVMTSDIWVAIYMILIALWPAFVIYILFKTLFVIGLTKILIYIKYRKGKEINND